MIFGGRLRLLLHDAFLVLRTCHATAAERERALHSFRAYGVLEKAEQHHLFDLYEIAMGCRPRYPSDSTTPLRERVLEAARDKEILVIPGWEESDTPIDKTPARPEAKVAQQVMAREKELAFEGASYVVLPATSWKEFSQGSGRSFEVVRREVAKATLLRMSAQAATSDRKRALAEAAELAADGNVAFGGLFLARRRIERTFVAADETPVLTPSQMRRALMTGAETAEAAQAGRPQQAIEHAERAKELFGTVLPTPLSSSDKAGGALIRPATQQPRGGMGVVLRDGEGATAAELKASNGGPTGGSRAGQAQIRQQLLDDAAASGEPFTCWRCGQTTTDHRDMHLGHRNVPTSGGGNLSPANVCLEGTACNLSAGNRGAPGPGMSCAERGSCGAPYGR